MDGMNYCETEHEHIDLQANLANERDMNPCDIHWAKYLLHDNASPSESPLYFRTLKGAYTWAQTQMISHMANGVFMKWADKFIKKT